MNLEGKSSLVTGAARRIGRAIALALAAEGANVVVHYGDSEREALALCDEIERRGARASALKANLDDPVELEGLIGRAAQAFGPLDVLVNNASVFPADTVATIDLQSLRQNMEVNAWAPFALSRAFREQTARGRIVNLLDTRISGYDRAHVGYILSKHVLTVLTRMTALEFAPEVTVNAVAPGLILPPPGEGEEFLERIKETLPLQRIGEPSEVADAVLFLAKSDFITGQIVYVDGGRHLRERIELSDGQDLH